MPAFGAISSLPCVPARVALRQRPHTFWSLLTGGEPALTLLVIPAIYATVKGWQLTSAAASAAREQPTASPAE